MAAGRDILLVDDDGDIREMLGAALEMHGYRVQLAENGARALELLRQRRPDLILLDLRMPVMDGPEFYRRCRADEAFARIPIVLMSAYADLPLTTARLRPEASLQKPFDVDDLIGVVERALGARPAA